MTTRREFIKAAAAGGAALWLPGSAAVPSKSDVAVGKGEAAAVIPRLLKKLGGMGAFVKPGSRVVIKPNMSFANGPECATTTSPAAVFTVAKLCLDAGASRVIIADNTLRDPGMCRSKSGIADAVKALGKVTIATPTSAQAGFFEEKKSDRAALLTSVALYKELAAADLLISLPIAKAHAAAGVSLGIKGLMGLVRDRGRMHHDMDLHAAIAEQLYYMKPALTIVDASRALLDNGPGGPGTVQELNTFVAGTDPVAVDSFAVTLAKWYGKRYEGREVKHLARAAELGFGNVESARIREIAV